MACTISLRHEQEIQKEKILQRAGYEPTIMCITAAALTTKLPACLQVIQQSQYMYIAYLTRMAGDEAQDQPHPPPPGPP